MVDILLATYNGQNYLNELLSSLEAQTFSDWQLLAGDDGSTDETLDILKEYQKKSSHSVRINENSRPAGSGKVNFFHLMKKAESDYVMFCDQDDVWLPGKIRDSYAEMKRLEKIHGANTPLLVYTDLCVVDEKLNVLNSSFYQYSSYPKKFELNDLLCMNQVTGCTILANRALIEKAGQAQDYEKILMHDSWLTMTAMVFGHISFIDHPTILYRQHGDNSVGAADTHKIGYKLKRFANGELVKNSNYGHIMEASYFLDLYQNEISDSYEKEILKEYGGLKKGDKAGYRKVCRKYHIFKRPVERKIGQLFWGI